MRTHRLSDQNLLRHNLIQQRLTSKLSLLSDSAPLFDLIKILIFSRVNLVLHVLELYSISYSALISEYKYRWSSLNLLSYLGAKSLIGFISSLLKTSLLICVAYRCEYVIVSSSKRASYLQSNGVRFKIKVLRNKPIYDGLVDFVFDKKNIIVLIGNMYGQYDKFLLAYNFACRNDYQIMCYGLTSEDRAWFIKMNFSNVSVHERLNQIEVANILKIARYSFCFYPNTTINNCLSASSKIFEILYFNVIPIISYNEGLIFELKSLAAPFVLVESLDNHAEQDTDGFDRYDRSQLLFYSELSVL